MNNRNLDYFKGKITFNSHFKSYIRVINYVSDMNWTFVLCTSDGITMSEVMNAVNPATTFIWQDVEKEMEGIK